MSIGMSNESLVEAFARLAALVVDLEDVDIGDATEFSRSRLLETIYE